MKKLILSVLAASLCLFSSAQIYQGKTNTISFFSDAPLEDIEATSKHAAVVMNLESGAVAAKMKIRDFVFENGTMQEHFNENYMESDKYPHATFKGNIQEKIDYSKDGVHKVKVAGTLEIHGVKKERTIEGTLTVKGGEITFESKFPVALRDHNIKIPEMVFNKIAETVEVSIKTVMTKK